MVNNSKGDEKETGSEWHQGPSRLLVMFKMVGRWVDGVCY